MASLSVEVVYALPSGEDAVTLTLAAGATAADAVRASGVLERHPEIDLGRQRLGIHGRVVAREGAASRRRPRRDLPAVARRREGGAPQARVQEALERA